MRTTASNGEWSPMRHIPEDELHAYLDQALSRTQCVEIESHLADCPSCRATRDGIAALRDRTTALLARLAPPTTSLAPFDTLRGRAAEAQSQRRRRVHAVAWAASLIVALGLGWSASSLVQSHDERAGVPGLARALDTARPVAASIPDSTRSTAAAPPALPAEAAPLHQSTVARHAAERPTSRPPRHAARSREVVVPSSQDSAQAAREATLSVLSPTPRLELTGLDAGARQDDLGGMWRTMSWDGAKAEAGERLPHIDGLPVVQVQVQSGEQSSRPVTVVAQQLASGQVIRTIEGPATDVSQLLSRRSGADSSSLALSADSARINDGHAMAMQVGDRMLAITGDLPSDSLRAMIRRLNAELRTK
jgi:Putative zinc-finger